MQTAVDEAKLLQTPHGIDEIVAVEPGDAARGDDNLRRPLQVHFAGILLVLRVGDVDVCVNRAIDRLYRQRHRLIGVADQFAFIEIGAGTGGFSGGDAKDEAATISPTIETKD